MSTGFEFSGVRWRREGRGDYLRYIGDVYQGGDGECTLRVLVIESLDSIIRSQRRVFEVRLLGVVVTTKPTLRAAKKVGENHLRWELDKMARGLAFFPPFIERVRGVCGGRTKIVGARIPVWAIELLRRQGASTEKILAAYPNLKKYHVVAALKYASEHADEIQNDIGENRMEEADQLTEDAVDFLNKHGGPQRCKVSLPGEPASTGTPATFFGFIRDEEGDIVAVIRRDGAVLLEMTHVSCVVLDP